MYVDVYTTQLRYSLVPEQNGYVITMYWPNIELSQSLKVEHPSFTLHQPIQAAIATVIATNLIERNIQLRVPAPPREYGSELTPTPTSVDGGKHRLFVVLWQPNVQLFQ